MQTHTKEVWTKKESYTNLLGVVKLMLFVVSLVVNKMCVADILL